jgi:fatty-acyl-CoA synthase
MGPSGFENFHVTRDTRGVATVSMEVPGRTWVEGLTVGAALRQTARRFPTRDAMVFSQEGVRFSWAELDREVDRIARGLLALGFCRGDHLGVWSTNWPEWVLLQFATARIGVVLATINPAYRATELQYTLAQSDVRGLALIEQFKSSSYFLMLREVCPELDGARPGKLHSAKFPHLQWVIGMHGLDHPGLLNWRGLTAAAESVPAGRLAHAERQLAPGDPVNLQYTSGTTGRPKGALLSHRNLLLNAFYAAEGQRLGESDRICIPVPLYHCFGCVLGTMCAAVSGAAMIFPRETFDVAATLEAVEAERCTAIYGVPTMFIGELEHPSFRNRNLSSLRTGIMAGSPCPVEIMKRVTRDMGAREITIAYGQTEASPLITMTRTDDPLDQRVGTVGRPLAGIEVKIIEPLSGRQLPDGQPGELCCRGHDVMLGYYNMPEATAATIDADGWLHTGDIAVRQPDGYFRITGRLREIIIRGGENIAPREIEELLYQHPQVEQVAVVGVPDRKFGEEILAWIKLRDGETATAKEIRDFCRQRLAHFKTPGHVKFVDGFPMTVTGKIQKYKIRQQAIEELGLQEVAFIHTA